MEKVPSKSGYRRGYAVAILVGFEEDSAVLWRIYSKVVKPEATVRLEGTRNTAKDLYNFHEAVVNALKPTLKEGVRSLILASPPRTTYPQEFMNHLRRHHAWLMQGQNRVTFAEITGSAGTRPDVAALTKSPLFHEIIQDATSEESGDLLGVLESKLGGTNTGDIVLYSLEDVESLILQGHRNDLKPEFLLLTDRYLAASRQKNRLNRLMQIAANKKVRTRVVDAESPAGKRLGQLGGIVCLAKTI